MFQKAPSRLVLSNGGKGPYSHYGYPIGGFRSARDSSLQSETEEAEHSAIDYLPDVLPVHSPPASKTAADKSTTEVSRPLNILSETIVDLPPKKVAAESSRETSEPSDQVKNFLQRVPDLSFMLSSKLSVPEK